MMMAMKVVTSENSASRRDQMASRDTGLDHAPPYHGL